MDPTAYRTFEREWSAWQRDRSMRGASGLVRLLDRHLDLRLELLTLVGDSSDDEDHDDQIQSRYRRSAQLPATRSAAPVARYELPLLIDPPATMRPAMVWRAAPAAAAPAGRADPPETMRPALAMARRVAPAAAAPAGRAAPPPGRAAPPAGASRAIARHSDPISSAQLPHFGFVPPVNAREVIVIESGSEDDDDDDSDDDEDDSDDDEDDSDDEDDDDDDSLSSEEESEATEDLSPAQVAWGSEEECIVCMHAAVNTMLAPCGHCLCHVCKHKLRKTGSRGLKKVTRWGG